MTVNVPQKVYQILNLIEKYAANAQGKGYGSSTMRQEVALLQSFLKTPPKLAIDIGGNIGNYTAELRKNNPSLEIHIFEPSSTNIQKLKTRYINDPFIRIVPLGVSDAHGSATLFSSEPGSGSGSLTKRKLDHFNIPFNTTEMIHTIRFEDYWRDVLKKQELDMVKIDIEGHELDALKGFGSALDATKVLQFEFGGCNIDTRSFFQDFWYFFQSKSFELYRITPIGAEKITRYKESDEFFSTTNYIALNKQKNK